jgi:hypothetical protein
VAATAPHAGSVMTCPLSVLKSRPFVKAMDRLAEAAEEAVEAAVEVAVVVDVEDAEEDTRKKSENWRSYRWKTKH